jgi:hypothetical protein
MFKRRDYIFRSKIFILIVLFLFTLPVFSIKTVKVAILDNPNMPQKLWIWLQYEKAYLRGIEIAKDVSKKKGIDLVVQPFFYGTESLDVLTQVPKVKAWKPDLILGPHYSNQFLLLNGQFTDTLVLSSYASDKAIMDLPSNFHTLFPPDEVSIKATVDFINKKFHNRNVLIINRIDCKDCNDATALFTKIYHEKNPNIVIKQNNFLGESDNLQNVDGIMKGYQKGDLIFVLAVNLYNYTDLIIKISTYLDGKITPTFISPMDNWGNPGTGLPIYDRKDIEFDAYLVNPYFFNAHSKSFQEFYETYTDLYGAYPTETVSYVTFMTVMSAIDALTEFNSKENEKLPIKEQMLKSYQLALKDDPNWFRPHDYAVYQLESGVGEIIDKINVESYLSEDTLKK